MRRINAFAMFVLVLIAASVMLAGCSSSATKSASDSGGSSDSTASSGAALSDLTDALENEWSSEDWYDRIVDIRIEQQLLARVIVVETDLEPGNAESVAVAQQITSAVEGIGYDEIAPNLTIVGLNAGQLMGVSSGTAGMEILDLPAAPTSAPELGGWINTVFGDSGESWYLSIQTVELSSDVSGWSGTDVIVVRTDLPGGESRDRSIAQARMIGYAIGMMGQTLAENYQVLDANDENLTSGGIPTPMYQY